MKIDVAPVSPLPGFSLRQIEVSDVPDWYAYLSLPAVVVHTSWNLAGPDDLKALCSRCDSSSPDSPCRFAVVDLGINRLMGTIGFHTISALNRSAEIAYDFAPAYWGHGIASAMCRTVTLWSYRALNLIRVQATVLESNLASERVLQKCGFSFEGVLRAYRDVRGTSGNFKMYARLASDGA